ncbi:MAG: hypothetical protein M5U26_29555 [Planctomycetota bacterium]|nr:hypothetical protein [Planctomycetota bacterium]
MNGIESWIRLGGLLHLSLIVAGSLVPRFLSWDRHLAPLPELLRKLIWVHGAYIVLIIGWFAALALFFPAELAAGTTLSRLLCGFIAFFWLVRIGVQFAVFSFKPDLPVWWLKAGYHALMGVFIALFAIFSAATFASR